MTPTEELQVELPTVPDRPVTRRRPKKREATGAGLFGLGCALGWHLIHLAGESYGIGPASPDFWFHLAVEGAIASYAASLFLIFYHLLTRPRPPINPDDKPR